MQLMLRLAFRAARSVSVILLYPTRERQATIIMKSSFILFFKAEAVQRSNLRVFLKALLQKAARWVLKKHPEASCFARYSGRASGVGGKWPVQVISLPRPVRSEYPTEGAEAPSAEMLNGVGGSRGQVTGCVPLDQMPPARPRISPASTTR